jgi:arsenate reductase-like glutaredoxin family protein
MSHESMQQLIDCVKQLTDTVATMMATELELVNEVNLLKIHTNELQLMLEDNVQTSKEPLVTPVVGKESPVQRFMNNIKQNVANQVDGALEKDAST